MRVEGRERTLVTLKASFVACCGANKVCLRCFLSSKSYLSDFFGAHENIYLHVCYFYSRFPRVWLKPVVCHKDVDDGDDNDDDDDSGDNSDDDCGNDSDDDDDVNDNDNNDGNGGDDDRGGELKVMISILALIMLFYVIWQTIEMLKR